ncbi:unnamed protein product [Prorocentrum cordatum]|uniref:Uncharacterized protein n=1 Tax=Prorocentrum cordatum TaxID=2364126 RepID=A0ABN9Q8L9_9DINO|nr:unnamed protein product [Polarella glacialis]
MAARRDGPDCLGWLTVARRPREGWILRLTGGGATPSPAGFALGAGRAKHASGAGRSVLRSSEKKASAREEQSTTRVSFGGSDFEDYEPSSSESEGSVDIEAMMSSLTPLTVPPQVASRVASKEEELALEEARTIAFKDGPSKATD